MSDLAVIDDQPATRQAVEAKDRSLPGKVTGKLKRAMDAMVWDGKSRDEAAAAGNMSIHGLREALKRPHVRQYYSQQIEVLRESERAKNIHRLVEIRDKADNMPAINAIRMLEQSAEDDTGARGGMHSTPGLVVKIINVVPQPAAVTLDVVPAITHSEASD